MKNIRTAVIAGAVAVIAVIAAVLIVVASNKKNGLYITSFGGNVNISNSEKGTSESADAERKLTKGDVITVGSGGTCTLVYRTPKNTDTNYMVLTENSQVFVTDDFDGKNDSDIYLNRGTLISSNAEDLGACAVVRTANCSVSTGCAVSTVKYSIAEEGNFTDFASMGGNLYIQLYDEQGSRVNGEELLGPGRNGRVVSGSGGPYFAFLNTNAVLSDYSAAELKELFSISSYVQLEFSSAEIRDAYNKIHESSAGNDAPSEGASADESDELGELPDLPIQTAETIATTLPVSDDTETVSTTIITSESDTETVTSESQTETSASETTAEEISESETSSDETEISSETSASDPETDIPSEETDLTEENPNSDIMYTVCIIADDEISEQYVRYGEDAVRPADPYIEGKRFIGWDASFENITSDRTITALFEDEESDVSQGGGSEPSVHTVTVIIGDKVTTQEVADGSSANIPSSITLEGYTFKGWDSDFSNVTSDMTVSAILEPITCNVTFIVDGASYFTTVGYGETVRPPVSPTQNGAGQQFTGWDKSLSGITSDTTITALYDTSSAAPASYTVTFIVDGISYTQTVTEGQSASAPLPPDTNSQGETFRGWDKDYSSVTSDMIITAIYG